MGASQHRGATKLGAIVSGAAMAAAMILVSAPPVGAVDETDSAVLVTGEGTAAKDVVGLAVHPWTGDIYWAQENDHLIRRLDQNGDYWTVAGNGTAGFSGDGGDATDAVLNYPRGLAFDGAGNLYFADSHNHRIRQIDTLGFITTIAGGGPAAEPDGGRHAATDYVFNYPSDVDVTEDGDYIVIADTGNHQVYRLNSYRVLFPVAGSTQGFGGDGGIAVNARLSWPESVAFGDDFEQIYIGDLGNKRLRLVSDRVMSTVAGDGTGVMVEGAAADETGIDAIRDIALDDEGNIYLSDHPTDSIRKIDTDGLVTTLSGQASGAANTAAGRAFRDPTALTFDRQGRLLIGDFDEILRITPAVSPEVEPRSNIYGRPAEDQVRRLYRAAFGRVPDAAGLEFWLRRYQAGDSMESLAANFLASAESVGIYGANPSDRDFVTVVYTNVLRRAPDEAGFAYWLDQLAAGQSQAQVLAGFTDSDENILRTGTAQWMTPADMQIVRLYRAAFQRVPDEGGLAHWGNLLDTDLTLTEIAAEFISSDEAITMLEPDDSDYFVQRLYWNVLRRPADDAGKLFWLNQLEAGTTPAEVLEAFSESPENIELTGTA